MHRSRAIVIFDGSNFYYKLKSLNIPHKSTFDYHGFSQSLTRFHQLQNIYYCIGKIRASQHDTKARLMMAKQQALVTRLKKDGLIIQFGYLLKSDGNYHEKGVDIQLAVNLMRGAYKDEYDIAYLVSSDSDIIPAIDQIQREGKDVVYVGFKHQPSYALLKTCRQSKLLDRQDLLPFVK